MLVIAKRTSVIHVALACNLFVAACNAPVVQSLPFSQVSPVTSGVVYSLPRGLVRVTVSRDDKGKYSYSASPVIVPDSRYRYTLNFLPHSAYYDALDITVDGSGLLSSSKIVTEDKSADIIKEVGAIKDDLREIAKVAPVTDAPPKVPFSLTQLVDPFDQKSLAQFNTALKDSSGSALALVFSLDASLTSTRPSDLDNPKQSVCDQGFCVRVPIAVFMAFKDHAKGGVVLFSDSMLLPDPSTLVEVDVRRGPCVKKATDLKFTSGMLTTNNLDKPSEILGCLGVPAQIVKSILGVPQKK